MNQTCHTCKYWQKTNVGIGDCYLRPPAVILNQPVSGPMWVRPVVDHDDYCECWADKNLPIAGKKIDITVTE